MHSLLLGGCPLGTRKLFFSLWFWVPQKISWNEKLGFPFWSGFGKKYRAKQEEKYRAKLESLLQILRKEGAPLELTSLNLHLAPQTPVWALVAPGSWSPAALLHPLWQAHSGLVRGQPQTDDYFLLSSPPKRHFPHFSAEFPSDFSIFLTLFYVTGRGNLFHCLSITQYQANLGYTAFLSLQILCMYIYSINTGNLLV